MPDADSVHDKRSSPATWGLFGVLVWLAFVLWRFQSVETPEPLAALVLLAGWLVVFTLACWGGGSLAWRVVSRQAPAGGAERLIVLAAGAGVLAAAAAGLGLVGALRPVVVSLAGAAAALYGAWRVHRDGRLSWPSCPPGAGAPRAIIAIAALASLLAVPAASPFYDQLHYHLAFPHHWLRHGTIFVFPREAFSFFPAVMGLLYVYPLPLLGAWGAQAIHWWMGAVAVAAVGVLAARLAGPRAGWWAAAIFAGTPSVMLIATWAAADLGVAAFGAVGWLMVLDAREETGSPRGALFWVLAGAMAGLAVGCKYLALLTVAGPLFVALLVAPGAGRLAARFRRGALWIAGAAIAFGPWLVRNWIAIGNPLHPFLPQLFATGGTRADAAARAQLAEALGRMRFTPDFLRVATLGTFAPEGEAESIGPVYLALLPLAIWFAFSRRRRSLPLLAGAAAGVLGWAIGPPVGRYLLPALVPLAALAGAAWDAANDAWRPRLRPLLSALLTVALLWGALLGVSMAEMLRVSCTLGVERVETLMQRWVSYWPAVRVINDELPANARVLLVAESRSLYLDRDVEVEDPFRTPLLVELAERLSSAAAMADDLRRRGVTHVLFNDAEADRVARLNKRSEYFSPLSPAGRARLDEFRSAWLERIATLGPVQLFALRAPVS